MSTHPGSNGTIAVEPEPITRHEAPPAAVRSSIRAESHQKSEPTHGARRLFIGILIALALVAVVLIRHAFASSRLAAETREMAVPTVTTIQPQAGPAQTEIVLPGNLMAYTEASIYARTNGYIKAWYTDIGAKVQAGQLMAEIEAPDVDAQTLQAAAALAQARANLEIARLNFDRSKSLLATKVISQQEYDQERTSLDAQQAALQAGEANLQNLKVQQNFQKIEAPFAGIVTRRNTDVGALITSGNSMSANAPELFHIARTDILRLFIQVPEVYSSLVTIDSPAWLDVAEVPGEKFQGKVVHIAGALDSASRTLLTEIQVSNSDGRLFPGAYANVHLILHLKSAPIVIPINTVLFRGQGTQVGVVDASDTVHLQKVTVARDFGTSFEITGGIGPHDHLIVNPSDSLAEGAKVQVVQNPNPASPAAK